MIQRLLILVLGWMPLMLHGQITGQITTEDHAPLPGATILLLPDSSGQISDVEGEFSFFGLEDGVYWLEVSFLGFESQKLEIDVHHHHASPVLVVLEEKGALLETIVVKEEHAKQEMTLASEHVDEQLIEENLQGAFAKSIEKIPGISAINVGVGIAKPVIRGLSSNRIIVNYQGIKQESQQWGSDHGLEIDQFDVERVEIIKGPASLQYGSDGLGGVINIMPGRILPKNTIAGSVLGVYKSNNDHLGGSARLALNKDDIFFAARYSYQNFADYRVPADQFEYVGFTLPIYEQRLKNTGGRERNFSFTGGISRDWGITRITVSQYSLSAGLFAGAVGIPRSYALTDDGNPRDIDVPKQEVDHLRVALNQTFVFGPDHLNINVGYQRNLREEFSFPEFHSIPSSQIDPGNTLAMQLELETFSANFHYERIFTDDWKAIYGGNVQWQQNRRGGFEFLLPDFRTFRGGLFALSEKKLRNEWTVNGGLRADYATNRTDFYRQFVWDSNENITDSLIAPVTDDPFFNWSASAGLSIPLRDQVWYLKANVGKSFRVPYPSETVSNGIHHGTFRHEQGTPDLESEHGYQLDVSTDLRLNRFSANLAVYFNYFDNYIYLGPTFPAQFSPLPESGQIFKYRQDDAVYTGFELQWEWTMLPVLRLQQAVDFVQSYNVATGLALPFTPQPTARTSVRYFLGEKAFWEEFFLEVGHQYSMAAEGPLRVDRSERPTPGYQLWNLGAGLKVDWHGQPLQLNVQVQNLLDTYYLNHLSRYRLINVPEQGRNVVVSLKVPFSGNW